MVLLRDESRGCSATERALTPPGRTLSAAHLAALDAVALRVPPSRAPPPPRPMPGHRLYCGWCHDTIEDVGLRHVAQCAHCGRSVAVPAYITVVCDRCGHSGRVPPRKLAGQRLCAVCGKALLIGDLVLAPYRHHHHHHHHKHGPTPYGDAAWAMLIIGLTLVLLVLSLTVLT